ncbi:MAG: hypothetical protein II348_00530 [Clostridia bacterium]|nr:hypothetical protein [Clostridia bacterium]
MLQSLLLTCLFFGLISMIIPNTSKKEWIYLLLLFVVISSLGFTLLRSEVSMEFSSAEGVEYTSSLPESAALNSVVYTRVSEITGSPPRLVENDLTLSENGYRLTRISVVLQSGNAKEVQNALEESFSFQGFQVSGGEDVQPGGAVNLLPKK